MKLRPVSIAVLALLASMAHTAQADDTRRPYIVQLAAQPIASYNGGVAGLPATQPSPGSRLLMLSPAVQQYTQYLDQKRGSVQAVVANAPIQHEYKVVLNGFSAMLTDDEVRQLQANPDVAQIEADMPRSLQTSYTTSFLGLDQPGGVWSQLNGTAKGEDVVVGIIDSGVWPENLSYADRVDGDGKPTFDVGGTLAYNAPAGWNGACESGEGFTASHCNNKLIGARFFNATFEAQNPGNTHWTEFRSPRDSAAGAAGEGSHGTHTSSTAAGNGGVATSVNGIPMPGLISGMAPRARVAVYKVCWSYTVPVTAEEPNGVKNSCFGSDSVAAIERAIADGVHVLNYSISGGESYTDSVEQAFLNAANAGIFVSASAGNSGPANMVAHVSPWLTTVGASTHGRELKATLTLGNGGQYSGLSVSNNALPPAGLIRAEDAALPGASAEYKNYARLCYRDNDVKPNTTIPVGPVFDTSKTAGKIVVCTRGTTGRVDKGSAVLAAGGAGMVLVNAAASGAGSDLYSDFHVLPAVHVTAGTGAPILAYAGGAGATASLSRFFADLNSAPAPMMADFSSRGPNRYDPNLLKPDVTAPGVAILAGGSAALSQSERDAVSNGTLQPSQAYTFMQGTSMSSPHVAGLAALLRQLHPTWSPAAIKSALMTTGTMTKDDGLTGAQNGRLPWSQGAGHVNPNKAMDPGLVYDLSASDYKKYMCGGGVASQCAEGAIPGYELNLPSITLSNVQVSQTVTRRVTNVSGAASTYTATPSITGYTMEVTPSTLTLNPGETKSYSVKLTRTNAPNNTWQFGELVWSDGVHSVRSPVQAQSGKAVTAPAIVSSDRTTGNRALGLSVGFTGKLGALKGGLKEVTRSVQNVAQAIEGSVDDAAMAAKACKDGAQGARGTDFTFPAGTVAARFETFNRDTVGGAANDLDMVLIGGAGTALAYSGRAGSTEAITLASPPAGSYRVCVIGYAAANGVSTDYTLSSAIVTTADVGGNFKVMLPSKVIAGSSATVGASWSGLALGKRYLGGVQFLDQNNTLSATTLFNVETSVLIPEPAAVAREKKRDTGL
ncbi:S8 family peptidase [Pseudoduganella namucuonensis]|uniref:Peptidase inhibitor I9 n=1 Tax=Pseudoduganella namucuonensis TaxID=1035707 RepID=A0A1I7LY27_9BURK|nr:S8 family peptidase [Pseudoduganella namucuonensis]SFV14612.1 Peptidase inhibitor I9 [Pseudoduganella namucuonensis]